MSLDTEKKPKAVSLLEQMKKFEETTPDLVARIRRFIDLAPEINFDFANNPSLSLAAMFARDISKRVDQIQVEQQHLERIKTLSEEISGKEIEVDKKNEKIKQLEKEICDYNESQKLAHLNGKILPEATEKAKTDDIFFANFQPEKHHNCLTISIDIRSSTDLMLNSHSTEQFAKFISELCEELRRIVLSNGGVFDKFTGDGIIAFFPDFYSGNDMGLRVLKSASEAVDFFEEHYKKNREVFKVVLTDAGIGVGIDYGPVQFVKIGDSLSAVGDSVVYACRLSSVGAGKICFNQTAYKVVSEKYPGRFIWAEEVVSIKTPGKVLGYFIKPQRIKEPLEKMPWK